MLVQNHSESPSIHVTIHIIIHMPIIHHNPSQPVGLPRTPLPSPEPNKSASSRASMASRSTRRTISFFRESASKSSCSSWTWELQNGARIPLLDGKQQPVEPCWTPSSAGLNVPIDPWQNLEESTHKLTSCSGRLALLVHGALNRIGRMAVSLKAKWQRREIASPTGKGLRYLQPLKSTLGAVRLGDDFSRKASLSLSLPLQFTHG